ncbi:MAG: glycerol-3-phosphate 1-O-acyltransferase PlsY [Deltaproteobacteria bacterium]|nr:glycerol-3-phosphate 1-O-acyltransferase PlsY [Deltaproteobacteria bacterium]
MLKAILLWFMAYLLGSIPVGVIVAGYLSHCDPRKLGSGNIGATNVARTAGKKAGLVTLGGDCLKGLLAVWIARLCGAGNGLAALTGLLAFLGHLYPIFLDFKGGKGVATALGVFLALNPAATVCGVLVFALVTAVSHFVSLGSICAALIMPVLVCQFNADWQIVFTSVLIAGLIVYRHRDNLLRLSRGEENRLY